MAGFWPIWPARPGPEVIKNLTFLGQPRKILRGLRHFFPGRPQGLPKNLAGACLPVLGAAHKPGCLHGLRLAGAMRIAGFERKSGGQVPIISLRRRPPPLIREAKKNQTMEGYLMNILKAVFQALFQQKRARQGSGWIFIDRAFGCCVHHGDFGRCGHPGLSKTTDKQSAAGIA